MDENLTVGPINKKRVTGPEVVAAVIKEVEAGTHGDGPGMLRDINMFLDSLEGKPGYNETQIITQRAIAEMWVREVESGNKAAMSDLLRIRGFLKRDHWELVGDSRGESDVDSSPPEQAIIPRNRALAPLGLGNVQAVTASAKADKIPKTKIEIEARTEAVQASYRKVEALIAELGEINAERLAAYGIRSADAPSLLEKMKGIRYFLREMGPLMSKEHLSSANVQSVLHCGPIFEGFAGDVRYLLHMKNEPPDARADRAKVRADVEMRMKEERAAALLNNDAQEGEFSKLHPEVLQLLMQAFKAGIPGHTKTEKEIERKVALAKVRKEGKIVRAYDELNEYLRGLRDELQASLLSQRQFDTARQAYEQLQIPVQDIAREVLRLELADEKSYQRLTAPISVVHTNALLLAGFKDEDVRLFTEAAFMVGARADMRTNALRGDVQAKQQFVEELNLERFQQSTKEMIRLVAVIDSGVPRDEGILYTNGRILVTYKGSGTAWEISIPRDATRQGLRPARDQILTHTFDNISFRDMISWSNDHLLTRAHRIPLPRERRAP